MVRHLANVYLPGPLGQINLNNMNLTKYLLKLGLLLLPSSVFSQISDIVFFDFESEESIILVGDSTNTWQIGKPDKNLFVDSRSGLNAIITDTTNSYPVNDTSSFYFTIYKPEYDMYCALWFSFWHKFETDSTKDYGFVDFSFDGGDSWHQGANWNLYFEEVLFWREYVDLNIGRYEDPIITGDSHGWVRDEYTLRWAYGVKKGTAEPIYPDSILFRFNFISDSIQTNKDGWMIDDIRVEKLVCGGIQGSESLHIKIFPNPTPSELYISSTSQLIESLKIFDLAGNCIISIPYINSTTFSLNLDGTHAGMYILHLTDGNNKTEIMKILKY